VHDVIEQAGLCALLGNGTFSWQDLTFNSEFLARIEASKDHQMDYF
jgi:hypothetical protein